MPARPSAIDAARDAIAYTSRQLFPFRFERWLALGFVAFVDQCGRGGGGGAPGGRFYGFPGGGGGGGGGSVPDLHGLAAWLAAHLGLLVVAAIVGLALMVALSALVLWVGSRGVFMYLDNVATGRADVERPWHEHRERAGSLFAWRFGLALAGLVAMLILLVSAAGLVMAAGATHDSGMLLALSLLVFLPLLLVLAVAAGLASMALRDFVAPLQWQQGIPCGEAVRLVVDRVRAHPGAFAVYALLKIVFGVLVGAATTVACCVLCCCVFIPVVAQTLLQPLFFFERAWSLYFLRQLGHDLLGQPPGPGATPAPAPS